MDAAVYDTTDDATEDDDVTNETAETVIEYDYEGTPCENHMCGDGGKCVSDFEKDTYSCDCFDGYTASVEPNLKASCRRETVK